jgi:hypothetical protein
MARKKRKAATPRPTNDNVLPTAERGRFNTIESAGMAKRVVSPIRLLFDRKRITGAQYDALSYYRQQAQQAQDDEAEMSPMHPAKAMGGGGGNSRGSSIPASLLRSTPAIIETSRIEAEILRYGQDRLDLLRFIARDDNTLTEWCINRHGGRERYDGAGRFVAMVPCAEKRVMAQALIDLKYVAGAIVR